MCSYIAHNEPVLLWTGRAMLDGRASIPGRSDAIVLIAGLGGTFHHERIRGIAARLNDEGFATIIADILTPDEQQFDARTGHFRVDTDFLAERIGGVIDWMKHDELTRDLPVYIVAITHVASAAAVAASRTQTALVPDVASILDDDVAAETVAAHVTEWIRMHMPVLA